MAKAKTTGDQAEMLWKIHDELRKEILETLRNRTQVINFKITFTSTVTGFILANLKKEGGLPGELLFLPAVAAIFFDLLVTSYSFSIKRVGFYIREYLEPNILSKYGKPNDDFLMWEKFVTTRNTKQNLSLEGNIGMTILITVVAIFGAFSYHGLHIYWGVGLSVAMIIAVVYDIFIFYRPSNFYLRSKNQPKAAGAKT